MLLLNYCVAFCTTYKCHCLLTFGCSLYFIVQLFIVLWLKLTIQFLVLSKLASWPCSSASEQNECFLFISIFRSFRWILLSFQKEGRFRIKMTFLELIFSLLTSEYFLTNLSIPKRPNTIAFCEAHMTDSVHMSKFWVMNVQNFLICEHIWIYSEAQLIWFGYITGITILQIQFNYLFCDKEQQNVIHLSFSHAEAVALFNLMANRLQTPSGHKTLKQITYKYVQSARV